MILCCGEALIDMIPAPTTDGRTGFVPHSGGAIFNTSIGLGRLGIRTSMLTGLSTDVFGRQLDDALKASHVDTSLIVTSARQTTMAFVQLVDGHATYLFYDEGSAARMLTVDDLPELPDHINALYFGGISLISEPAADAYLALAEREAGNRVIMIDPNIRPSFIVNEESYRARLMRFLAVADIVKTSDEDLGWIQPGPEAMAEKLDALQNSGPKVIILTRGGDGADGFIEGVGMVHAEAKRVEIADTVGAGDTFNAGVLAQLARDGLLSKERIQGITRDELQTALSYGAAVAAITVSRHGANPPWRHEVES